MPFSKKVEHDRVSWLKTEVYVFVVMDVNLQNIEIIILTKSINTVYILKYNHTNRIYMEFLFEIMILNSIHLNYHLFI
jgi:hypothetical protein